MQYETYGFNGIETVDVTVEVTDLGIRVSQAVGQFGMPEDSDQMQEFMEILSPFYVLDRGFALYDAGATQPYAWLWPSSGYLTCYAATDDPSPLDVGGGVNA